MKKMLCLCLGVFFLVQYAGAMQDGATYNPDEPSAEQPVIVIEEEGFCPWDFLIHVGPGAFGRSVVRRYDDKRTVVLSREQMRALLRTLDATDIQRLMDWVLELAKLKGISVVWEWQ